MKMKKSLLCFTTMAGLLSVSVSFAGTPLPNRLGYIPASTTATVLCSASRFFPGSPPPTIVANEAVGGLETNFLITNTSGNTALKITKIEVYGMTGAWITTLTPGSPITTPVGDPAFKWKLAPHETTRLPHEATLPAAQQSKPELLWNNVVFTVASVDGSAILAPLVYSDYIEKATPLIGGGVLDRIRADCVYR
ncbi:MAG: hypothetical protein QX199_20115 [Methylococcaceae bacterium]